MGTRMLIDASHAEESRVAILENDRLEEFDFETTTKKQLKGNIYLAKIIRIEPSLQAAFVEFGGGATVSSPLTTFTLTTIVFLLKIEKL